MNTELTLKDASGVRFSVDVNQLTPMGFECIVSQPELSELRDDTGRFREFEMILGPEDQSGYDCVGVCRVHSVRRICADKSVVCVRFEDSARSVYERLIKDALSRSSSLDLGAQLRRA